MRIVLDPDHLAQIGRELIEEPPERLMHIVGRELSDRSWLVTALVLDEEAEASPSSVRASSAAQSRINQIELETGDRLIGVVHSHPRGHPRPSGQDGFAIRDLLTINPTLQVGFVGVASHAHTLPTADEWVHQIDSGQLVMAAMQTPGNELQPAAIEIADASLAFSSAVGARQPASAQAAVRGRRVMVVGLGSVGSRVAEELTRSGIPSLCLIDPDVVEAANLSRSVYVDHDIGEAKVAALARRLRAINPRLHLTEMPNSVDAKSVDSVRQQMQTCDVVVAVTDNARVQGMIDSLLFDTAKPGVFGAVYRAAEAGEIITVIPGMTACYRCAVGPRMEENRVPGVDYSTGRINGALALGTDISVIATCTARTALGVLGLLNGTDTWLQEPIVAGRSFTQIGLQPGALREIHAFEATPAQHAWQSLWTRPEGGDDCPYCAAPNLTRPEPTNAHGTHAAQNRRRIRHALSRRVRKAAGGHRRPLHPPS